MSDQDKINSPACGGVRYAKYDILRSGNITKDGHNMFMVDVVKDLNRKSRLEAENERLRAGINQAVAGIWSWMYSIKQRHISDIYDDLKALVKGDADG